MLFLYTKSITVAIEVDHAEDVLQLLVRDRHICDLRILPHRPKKLVKAQTAIAVAIVLCKQLVPVSHLEENESRHASK